MAPAEVKGDPLSPVQEHHIDFLLEEEFACNAAFLTWFFEHVRWRADSGEGFVSNRCLTPGKEWNCSAVRSVTTDRGETDVLVTYESNENCARVALLIEDKIRANLQCNQAKRYLERGARGKQAGLWTHYWSCLISPEQYPASAKETGEFDATLSLETLETFFAAQDLRTKFKASVLTQALERFHRSGVQVIHEEMTRFRALYALKAEAVFGTTTMTWPRPREAWWGDSWFRFTGGGIPKGADVTYKAQPGFVDLAFSNSDANKLQRELEEELKKQSHPMQVVQTNKSASLRLFVAPVNDFSNPEASTETMEKSLEYVRTLVDFYMANQNIIQNALASQAAKI